MSVTKCAEAGKHVYLDKPMALNPEDANRIVDAVCQKAVYAPRCSAISIVPGHALIQRRIGRVDGSASFKQSIAMYFSPKGHPGTAPVGEKRIQKPTLERYSFVEAKPEMFDVGVYAVSMVNWLTQKRVQRVFGGTANYFFKEHLACDLEDFGALVLTLEDGIDRNDYAGGRYGWQSHAQGGVRKAHLIGTEGEL